MLVLRRRWAWVLLAGLVGVTVGWFSGIGGVGPPTYEATHVLLFQPQSGSGETTYNLDQLTLLATTGDVPTQVADSQHLGRDQVRSMVSAVSNPSTAVISITARSPIPVQAKSLADATAAQLVADISAGQQSAYQAGADRARAAVQAAQAQLAQAQAAGPGAAAAQADASSALAGAQQALAAYLATPAPASPLTTLETAQPSAAKASALSLVAGRPTRSGVLGGLGLLLGVGVILGLDSVDHRIRSKHSAEEIFGLPVLAEVPPPPRSAGRQLLTGTQPSSPYVEAYRGLKTMITLWATQDGDGRTVDFRHRVIMVTSPLAEEGKTTTVAHLAALLAEAGYSVLTVSADFRRPELHNYFGRNREPGLADILGDGQDVDLGALDLTTNVKGVQLIASGTPVDNPAPLIERFGDLLRPARRLFDFVLVDAPPLLVVNDAIELARYADGVVLVARAGRTPTEASRHSSELLQRIGVPVVGITLVSSDGPGSSSYYRSHYRYGNADKPTSTTSQPTTNGNHPM